VSAELIEKLPYLEAVSKEALRLYPPVPGIGRVCLQDTIISGVRVPKGTVVKVFPWALNRSTKLWGKDALEYNPERWLVGEHKSTGGAIEPLSMITFGTGVRGCIGKSEYHVVALLDLILMFERRFRPGRTQNSFGYIDWKF
jgi:cytochrome P450